MPGSIETPKINKNTNTLEDLSGVIYEITKVLENFENDLKQLKEGISKRIKKLETLFLVSLNTYDGNVQPELALFESIS